MAVTNETRPRDEDFERADGLARAMLAAVVRAQGEHPYAAAHILAAVALFEVDVVGRVLQVLRDDDQVTRDEALTTVAQHGAMVMQGLSEVLEELWPTPAPARKGGDGGH